MGSMVKCTRRTRSKSKNSRQRKREPATTVSKIESSRTKTDRLKSFERQISSNVYRPAATSGELVFVQTMQTDQFVALVRILPAMVPVCSLSFKVTRHQPHLTAPSAVLIVCSLFAERDEMAQDWHVCDHELKLMLDQLCSASLPSQARERQRHHACGSDVNPSHKDRGCGEVGARYLSP
jgi:hypothetical protein